MYIEYIPVQQPGGWFECDLYMHGLAQALGLGVSPATTAFARSLAQHCLLTSSSRPFATRAFTDKTSTHPSVLPFSRTTIGQARLQQSFTFTRRHRKRLFSAFNTYKMASNGDVNHKRKTSPVNIEQRPPKHLKPEISNILNGDTSSKPTTPSEEQEDYIAEDDDPADVSLPPIAAMAADSAEWQATIEQVVKNVVSIHFCQTCAFDTDSAMSSEATGFVVDAKRGYILTNRHVVGSGPFWGFCILIIMRR